MDVHPHWRVIHGDYDDIIRASGHIVAVTVAFIICWAPFHTQRLMVLYVNSWTPQMLAAQSHIFYVSGVLYFVSSTVNPILYNVISRRYRVAFRQTICGPCRQYGRRGAFFSRQSVGSHAASRHGAKKGGEQAYVQQRHSLLGPESPPVASLPQPTFSQKSTPSETRAPRGGVRRYSSQATLLAPTWCPRRIRWKRKKEGGEYSAAVETKYSLDEPGQSHSHYFQLKALPQSKLQTHREASSLSTNHCNNVLYSSHHPPGDHVLSLGSDKPNQLCSSATGPKKASTKDEQQQRVNKTSPNLPQADTHALNVKRRNDSNDNSYSPKSSVEDSVDKTYGTMYVSGGDKTSPSPFASSFPSCSSHQHSVARESGSSGSLCKQCLTNPSPTPNGSAPYSDVEAYHVGYDVSKPHSHL